MVHALIPSDRTADQTLRSVILAGERLLWMGRKGAPDERPEFTDRGFIVLAVVGFPFLAAGLLAGITHAGAGWFWGSLIGAIFAGVGLAFAASPFWLQARRITTRYAITDRRLLTVISFPVPTITSVYPTDIGQLTVCKEDERVGDVVVGTRVYRDEDGERQHACGFQEVVDPERVAGRIVDAFQHLSPVALNGEIRIARHRTTFRPVGLSGMAVGATLVAMAGLFVVFAAIGLLVRP